MSNLNDKLIKQSQKAFFLPNRNCRNKRTIRKNYKLLLNQLDDYNGGILNDLIDIAERAIKNRAN